MNKEFKFLKKARFWSMVLAAVALALHTDGFINDAWFACLGTILGGFTVVQTIDRNVDKKVEVANIVAKNDTI